jgi:hypothetical protein
MNNANQNGEDPQEPSGIRRKMYDWKSEMGLEYFLASNFYRRRTSHRHESDGHNCPIRWVIGFRVPVCSSHAPFWLPSPTSTVLYCTEVHNTE